MQLMAHIELKSERIEEIIRRRIESTGAVVEKIKLYGGRSDQKIEAVCHATLITKQGDAADILLYHDQIMEIVNWGLFNAGYDRERLSSEHRLMGRLDEERGIIIDISAHVSYDLGRPIQ